MSILTFINRGTIDPISITTFGISAKENESAIGMFGTGLKYAIAVLLRNGYKITVFSGDQTYRFDVVNNDVRNKTFQHVTMNDQLISFTTELGKFWEPWMAIRELACNAMDEIGEWGIKQSYIHDDKNTTIVVSGRNIEELCAESKSVFIQTRPIIQSQFADAHPGSSEWIYYRGIRAMKLDKPSLYTWNILEKCPLTEDRTLKYSWDVGNNICRAINCVEDREFMTRCVGVTDTYFEGSICYTIAPSDLLIDVVGELTMQFKHVPDSLRRLCNTSLINILSEKDPLKLDAIDQQRLDKAVAFSERIGFNISRYQVIVTKHLGENILGRAAGGKIYISERTFHMGTKMLVGTLIEEYLHLAEGVEDCTRSMQNLLFDTICSLGERVTGEML